MNRFRAHLSPFLGMSSFAALLFAFSSFAWGWHPIVANGRCKKSGYLCRATIGNAGGRGACCDPRDPQLATCSVTDACQSTFPYHWPKMPVTWYFHPNGMVGKAGFRDGTLKEYETALVKAWDSWVRPCSSFRHKYNGQSKTTPSRFDGKTTLFFPSEKEWAQLGVSQYALAFSMPTANNTGELLDADIAYNPLPGGNWGVQTDQSGTQNFKDVSAHEVGHTLGLAHSAQNTSLMYFSVRPRTFVGQSADDVQAVCTIYPNTSGTCTQSSDCAKCHSCSGGTCVPNPAAQLSQKDCRTCKTNADCPGGKHTCVDMVKEKRCLRTCKGEGDCCPKGYNCQGSAGKFYCIPNETYCPNRTCQSKNECPTGQDCTQGICQPNPNPQVAQCKVLCKTNADCAQNGACVRFPDGRRRCTVRCQNKLFCPPSFQCRFVNETNGPTNTFQGRVCLPTDENFCPCLTDQDCKIGLVCRRQTCQQPQGGKEFDQCSDKAPCAKGLKCLQGHGTSSYCLRSCQKLPKDTCPKGTACKELGAFLPACVPVGTRNFGQTCHGLKNPCKQGLYCLDTDRVTGDGTCVEDCKSTKSCKLGGICGQYSTNTFICVCRRDSDCPSGGVCKILTESATLGEIGTCQCQGKPCPATQTCGNGSCEGPTENCGTCPQDCPCKGVSTSCQKNQCLPTKLRCGNGKCDPDENCRSCPMDCACPKEQSCEKDKCVPLPRCGDGKCETPENCASCQQDCPCQKGTTCKDKTCKSTATTCGNGTCDDSENCASCQQDCSCPVGKTCQVDKCVEENKACGNGQCDSTNENCSTCPADCACPNNQTCRGGACGSCGDGTCQEAQNENCETCEVDCACQDSTTCQAGSCVNLCGDGTCNAKGGENCETCPKDCRCTGDDICQKGQCIGLCGNGVCDLNAHEGCESCPQDCGCQDTHLCQHNICVEKTQLCVGTIRQSCDDKGKCENICEVNGCGCAAHSAHDPSASNLFILFAFFGLLGLRIRRKTRRRTRTMLDVASVVQDRKTS